MDFSLDDAFEAIDSALELVATQSGTVGARSELSNIKARLERALRGIELPSEEDLEPAPSEDEESDDE